MRQLYNTSPQLFLMFFQSQFQAIVCPAVLDIQLQWTDKERDKTNWGKRSNR